MNKTKIDWATMSWNPVTGCRHGCPYCYARRTAHRFDAGLEDNNALPGGLHVLESKVKGTPYPYGFEPTLHRYRLNLPERTAEFLKPLLELPGLEFRGISSHAGQVYGASRPEQVASYAAEESAALALAVSQVRSLGIDPEIVSTGSTPTFPHCVTDDNINMFHPGNYIFNDCIQISTDTAKEEECALTVLASVISHPSEDLFICDAGAKCLGLDTGAHGNASVIGHGRVIGHPELVVESLSEEVGKLRVKRTDENAAQQAAARKSEQGAVACGLKVGDLIRIIPNHACSAANLTDYYVGVRGENVKRLIEVDIRGNKTAKGFS